MSNKKQCVPLERHLPAEEETKCIMSEPPLKSAIANVRGTIGTYLSVYSFDDCLPCNLSRILCVCVCVCVCVFSSFFCQYTGNNQYLHAVTSLPQMAFKNRPAVATSLRQCNVTALRWRWCDVVWTLCARLQTLHCF